MNEEKLGALPQWDLSDLYISSNSKELLADLEEAKRAALEFENKYKGNLQNLTISGKLLEIIKQYEQLSELSGKISSYAFLHYAQKTDDAKRAKFLGDMQEALTNLSTNLIFFSLELNQIDEQILAKALAENKELMRYKTWFDNLRKGKPHQLEEKIEELFHDKSITGRSAWNRLFDETMASLKFVVDGETLGLEATLNLLSDKEEGKRKKGFMALAKVLKENRRLFTHITNVLAKDKEISDRWRKFKDVADSRHLANSLEGEVVKALVKAVRESYPHLSHRYYKMKAKWFNKEKLDAWDRNAPLPNSDNRIYNWEEAKKIVLQAYGDFSPELAKIAKLFFDFNWIDAPVKKGKSPGAFAHPTVPSVHPYLMLNYLGKPRDVMTLAHELGHGVHQKLAASQGALLAPTPLTLAETASVFGEMLTFRALYKQAETREQKFAMLSQKVEDMLNTVIRQIAFYSFERKVHLGRRNGELTTEQINEMWLETSRESLGSAIIFNEGYEYFWSYIPHFIHSPFYVYAYAFGDCLVNSLYAKYQEGNENFVAKYLDLLRAGGSKHHAELLKPFGLDARDKDFWALGLNMIENMIDELENLQAGYSA